MLGSPEVFLSLLVMLSMSAAGEVESGPDVATLRSLLSRAEVVVGRSEGGDSAPLPPDTLGESGGDRQRRRLSAGDGAATLSRPPTLADVFPRRRVVGRPVDGDTRRSFQVGVGAQVGMDLDYDQFYDRIFFGGRNRGKNNNNQGYGNSNNNQGYGNNAQGGGGGYGNSGQRGNRGKGNGLKDINFLENASYNGYLRNRGRNMKRFFRKMRGMMSSMGRGLRSITPRLKTPKRGNRQRQRPKQQQQGYGAPQQQQQGYGAPQQQQSSGYAAPQQQTTSGYAAPQTTAVTQSYAQPVITTTQPTYVVAAPVAPITPTTSFQYSTPIASTSSSFSRPAQVVSNGGNSYGSPSAGVVGQNIVSGASSASPVYGNFVPSSTQSTFVPVATSFQTSVPSSGSYTIVSGSNPFLSSGSSSSTSYVRPTVSTPTASTYSVTNVGVSPITPTYTCFNCNNNAAAATSTTTISRPSSSYSNPVSSVVSRPSSTFNVVSQPSGSSYSVVSSSPSNSYSGPVGNVVHSTASVVGSTYTVPSSSVGSSYSARRPVRQSNPAGGSNLRQQKRRDLEEMKAAWQRYMAKMRAYKRKYSEDEALRRFKKEVIAAARQKRRRSSKHFLQAEAPNSLADAIDKVFHEVQPPKLVDEEERHELLREQEEEEDLQAVAQTNEFNYQDEAQHEHLLYEEEEEGAQSLHSLAGISAVSHGAPSLPVVVGQEAPKSAAEEALLSLANYPREIEELLASSNSPHSPVTTPNPFLVGGQYVQKRPKDYQQAMAEAQQQGNDNEEEEVPISEVGEPFNASDGTIPKYRNILTPTLYKSSGRK